MFPRHTHFAKNQQSAASADSKPIPRGIQDLKNLAYEIVMTDIFPFIRERKYENKACWKIRNAYNSFADRKNLKGDERLQFVNLVQEYINEKCPPDKKEKNPPRSADHSEWKKNVAKSNTTYDEVKTLYYTAENLVGKLKIFATNLKEHSLKEMNSFSEMANSLYQLVYRELEIIFDNTYNDEQRLKQCNSFLKMTTLFIHYLVTAINIDRKAHDTKKATFILTQLCIFLDSIKHLIHINELQLLRSSKDELDKYDNLIKEKLSYEAPSIFLQVRENGTVKLDLNAIVSPSLLKILPNEKIVLNKSALKQLDDELKKTSETEKDELVRDRFGLRF